PLLRCPRTPSLARGKAAGGSTLGRWRALRSLTPVTVAIARTCAPRHSSRWLIGVQGGTGRCRGEPAAPAHARSFGGTTFTRCAWREDREPRRRPVPPPRRETLSPQQPVGAPAALPSCDRGGEPSSWATPAPSPHPCARPARRRTGAR